RGEERPYQRRVDAARVGAVAAVDQESDELPQGRVVGAQGLRGIVARVAQVRKELLEPVEHQAPTGSAATLYPQSSVLHTSISPSFFVFFSRRKAAPHLGQARATGRYQATKSHFG